MKILAQILHDLKDAYGTEFETLNIKDISLRQIYTVVELTNGFQGVALNYDNYGYEVDRRHYLAQHIEKELISISKGDNLLYNRLLAKDSLTTLFEQSVCVAILNALSQPFINNSFLSSHGLYVEEGVSALFSITKEGDTLCLIGFGGALPYAIQDSNIERIFVSELRYFGQGKKEIDQELTRMGFPFKGKEFEISDGSDSLDMIKRSDILCVTGSAFCNNTMDSLLAASGNRREVILQGHSCSFTPLCYL